MAFSVTIAGATAIDGTASGNGWVAIILIPGNTNTSGTLDPSQLSLTVSDPGYTNTGSTTTVNRSIVGMKPGAGDGTGQQAVRKVVPNANTQLITTNGTDLTIRVALDDRIYSGSTVSAASISGTFYTGVSGSSATSITNSSTRPYKKAMFGWNQKHWDTAGASFDVEGLAYHREMRNGTQVACVKYTATDGTNNSATVTVSAPTISTKSTKGYKPEVWAGTVSTSALTQGASCKVNAQVYPWIGDSGSVLDLSSDGTSWPTELPQTLLNFVCDKTGGYGTAYAYVLVGASGGTVSGVAATAAAAPFPTVQAALNAIPTWNNTNKGHNDLGGARVRLMDSSGSNAVHTMSSGGSTSSGTALFYIEKDPAATAEVRIDWDALCQMAKNFAIGGNGLILRPTGSYALCGQFGSREYVHVGDCTVENPVDEYNLVLQDFRSFQNITFTGTGGTRISAFGGGIALLSGCVATTAANTPLYDAGKVTVGNHFPTMNVGLLGGDGSEGFILANNRLYSTLLESTSSLTISKGVALIQNLTETDAVAGNNGFKYFADADLTTIDNLVVAYNTGVGERGSQMYNDTTTQVEKSGTARFNLLDNKNFKTDTFNSGTGSPGNWEWGYGTANFGELNLFGDVGRGSTSLPHNDSTDPSYLGMGAHPTSEYNLYRTALGHSQADIMGYFVNYTVQPRAVPALGGDYHIASPSTPLSNRVPAGLAGLAYDLDGVARKNDGTGAAGVYEAAFAPAIAVQPTDQTANSGSTATFTLTAAGATSYQWQDNSGGSFADISGAISTSYTTGTVAFSQQGRQYRCNVTNANGTTTSSAAVLRVAFNLTGTGPRAQPLLGSGPFGAGAFGVVSRGSVTAGAAALAATPAAQTTLTAALTTAIRLASAASSQCAVSAALTTSIRLAGATSAQCSVTAALSTSIPLQAALQAITTVSGTLPGTSAQLAADVQATVAVAASLSTSIRLAATPAGQCTLTGALSTSIPLASSAQAVATVGGALSTSIVLTAAASGQCTVTGALTTSIRLAGVAQSVVSVTADLAGGAAALASAVQCQTAVSGALTTSIRMASAIQGTTTVTASLSGQAAALAATLIAQAQVSAALTTQISLAAIVQAQTTSAASLSTAIRLQALMQAVCSLTAGPLGSGVFVTGNALIWQVHTLQRTTRVDELKRATVATR